MRIGYLAPLVALPWLWIAGACGDDSDSSGDLPANVGGSSPLADAGSVYGLALVNPECGEGDGGTVSDDCTDCTEANCATAFQSCFGSSWQTTLVGGVCSDFGTCVSNCPCGDNDCFKICLDALEANAGDPCRSCIVDLIACEQAHCASVCDDETTEDGGNDASAGSG